MTTPRYFRTLYTLEVLSDREISNLDMEQIAYEIRDGDCSGAFKFVEQKEVSADEMAKLLFAQGSDPDFLIHNA